MSIPRQKIEHRSMILLADGGALSDLNERLGAEPPTRDGTGRKDFARIPEAVVKALGDQQVIVDCPIESRFLCTVGSEKAQGFLTKMEQSWTVRAFPLSFAKYERAGEQVGDRHKFRLRFHAYLGYVLGLLTGASQAGSSAPLIGVMSDDAHLLPCLTDSRSAGIDARLVWWQGALGEEVSFFAARNGVPLLLLPQEDAPFQVLQHRDTAIEQLLKVGRGRR